MGVDYIPVRDSRAAVWMKFFAQRLVADPDAYRISADEAAQIDTALQAFRMANTVAWSNMTRTPVSVLSKNEARKIAEQLVRKTAQRVRVDSGISSALKVKIGLKQASKRRRYVGPPESVPGLVLEDSGMVQV